LGDDDPKPNHKPRKVKQTYSFRDVVKNVYKSRVDDEIPFESSNKKYLGRYQSAVTKVLENLTEKEVEETEKIQESWNKYGGPSEVQMK
jgi:hypothetical protein